MSSRKPALGTIAMAALLLAIAVAGHYASPLLLPKTDLRVSPEPGCNLQQQACAARLPEGGRIELSITPRPIPVLATLRVEATVSGITARKVEVDFAGETMNMGYNRVELSPAAGRHAGDASLPLCVSGGMNWTVTVLVETDRQRYAVPYRVAIGY